MKIFIGMKKVTMMKLLFVIPAMPEESFEDIKGLTDMNNNCECYFITHLAGTCSQSFVQKS